MTGRQGRRRKQLLYDLKVIIGYWEFKKKALYRTFWRTRLGRVCEFVVRQARK